VSGDDRPITLEFERFLAPRMNAGTLALDAGHLSMLAHPQAIAALPAGDGGRALREPRSAS
jgi:hypothetical protein